MKGNRILEDPTLEFDADNFDTDAEKLVEMGFLVRVEDTIEDIFIEDKKEDNASENFTRKVKKHR